jgi:hypothetical protein
MSGQRKATWLATVSLLAAAIAAPAAGAARHESRAGSTCHQYCGVGVASRGSGAPAGPAIVRTELVPSSDAGFHWADAAVGFAVACGGILLVFVSVLVARRTRFRLARGAS